MFNVSIDNNFIDETTAVMEATMNKIAGKTIESVQYGTGTIINDGSRITIAANVPDFIIAAEFADGVHKFLFTPSTKVIKFPDDVIAAINETRPALDEAFNHLLERVQAEIVRKELEQQKELEELEQKKKEAKIKAKLDSLKRSNIALSKKLDTHIIDTTADNYFVGLGYIAKHAKRISAAMPDYMEPWFIKTFGDAEHKIVDSTKRTVNGNPMQWALSMDITLDTNDGIPAVLLQHLSSANKSIQSIADTQFVFELVRDCGFTFGKKQNIDEIRAHVPASLMADFEFGMGL